MRCHKVEVTFKIPVPIDEPDGNGVMYSENSIINACKNVSSLPIVQFNDKGEEVVIGQGTPRYENQYIIVDGICWHGGTCESVKFDDNKVVTSMEFSSFGLTTL